ncbi:MAG: hypothetical protein FWG34_12795, partial [Oscillospiraceae bacterium]|nr:hypothetical protein [Oscillospiraceae bacterium]
MQTRKPKRHALYFALALAVLFMLLPMAAAPVSAAPTGEFDISTGTWLSGVTGTDCTWDGTTLTLQNRANIAVTGTPSGSERIEVAAYATATLTLNNVKILGLATGECALLLNSGANLTLILPDGSTNTLISGASCAGIQTTGATLTIEGGTAGTGELTAKGGDFGAGIGGGYLGDGGEITISGGIVYAEGGDYGAGIGGGYLGDGGEITISGGIVYAEGGDYGGAGIGGRQ